MDESLHILVVDDCPDTTQSIALLLQAWGHAAQVAGDGAEALRLAAVRRPDVVLLDVEMPRLNGWDLARQLRRLPGLDSVLLVAVTGHGREQDRYHSRQAGCDFHLIKPVEPELLHELLARSPRGA